MEVFQLVLISFFLVFVYFLHHTRRKGHYTALDSIPVAHWSVRYSSFFSLWIQHKNINNDQRRRMHKLLGPVVRIAPNEISVGDLDCVKTAFQFDKTDWYTNVFGDEALFMFRITGKEEHAACRRLVNPLYTKSTILNSHHLQHAIQRGLDPFLDNLDGLAEAASQIDVLAKLRALVIDITTCWLWGDEIATDFQSNVVERETYLQAFNSTLDDFLIRGRMNTLRHLLEHVPFTSSNKATRARRDLVAWCKARTENLPVHRQGSGDSSDPLPTSSSNLWSYYNLRLASAKSKSISFNQDARTTLQFETLDHVVAAQENPGIALAYAMYELSENSSWQTRLRDELQSEFADYHELLKNSSTLDALPVLDAVLRETLRFHTPNPGPWFRKAPSEGAQIGGFFIPGDTIITASAWPLHFNENVYPDSESWRPERWLELDPERKRALSRNSLTFGTGPFNCIGEHMAIRVMKTILAAVLLRFHIQAAKGQDVRHFDGLASPPISGAIRFSFRSVVS